MPQEALAALAGLIAEAKDRHGADMRLIRRDIEARLAAMDAPARARLEAALAQVFGAGPDSEAGALH